MGVIACIGDIELISVEEVDAPRAIRSGMDRLIKWCGWPGGGKAKCEGMAEGMCGECLASPAVVVGCVRFGDGEV